MSTATPLLGTSFASDRLLRQYAHFEDPAPAPPPDPPAPPAEDKKFTQADVDRVAGETRKQAKQAAVNDLLKELGFEKADDLKTLVKTAKDQAEAQKTEAQKAIEAKAALEKERDEAKAALTARNAEIEVEKRAALRDSAITKALTSANAKAEKVLKLLKVDQPDALAATLKEDGTVDEAKVKALIETARKAYPEDFGRGGVGSPSNNGGRAVQGQPPKVQTSGRL